MHYIPLLTEYNKLVVLCALLACLTPLQNNSPIKWRHNLNIVLVVLS